MTGPELFPVVVGAYEDHPALAVEPELATVAALFAEFGAETEPWAVPMDERGGDAVDRRLRDWSRPGEPADSVLYWLGHGWSDGFDVALAHARSPAAVRTSGLLPAQLAEAIRARQATAGDHWAIVVVDTCWSSRFVDKLNAELASGLLGADRVLLVGVSGDGSTALGRFSAALRQCLTENFRTDERIELWRLAAELDRRLPTGLVVGRRLGDAALTRPVLPLAAAVSLPLDLLRELETVLAALPPDERGHFVAKARGAQESELSWFFEGRADERTRIVRWLRTARTGLLIVTGRAGSGKSALLGHLLVHSRPDLRSVLVRSGLVDPLPPREQPADHVFDATIHLTGMTLDTLVRRIAAAVETKPLDASAATTDLLDRLIDNARVRREPLTLLVDALDEAVEPLVIARTVLRPLAALENVRLVVGTRASTREGLLRPEPEDEDLLDALTAVAPPGFAKVVWIGPDPDAMERYVTRRLARAGVAGADRIAEAAQDSDFLYAHLAVHEMIADPDGLGDPLPADHRGLFAQAAARLAGLDPAFGPLVEALALGRGRGIPIVGGVWAAMASALSPAPIGDGDVSAFLEAANPYVAVDNEAGQTVYRLAHRVLAEQLLGADAGASRQPAISHALIALTTAGPAAAGGRPDAGVANPYVVMHLSGHVADAGVWDALAAAPDVLDRLDPLAIAADALRTVFGGAGLPLPVAGVILARHQLAAAGAADRAGLRQLAMTALGAHEFDLGPGRPWTVRAGHAERLTLHVPLPGHTGSVAGLVFFEDSRLGRVLASAGDDGTVRLWDPATALPVGAPMTGHRGPVTAVCAVAGPGGRTLVATGGADGTVRLWDPATSTPVGPPLFGHDGGVGAICLVPGTGRTIDSGQVMLASGGGDGTVRLWDAGTGAPVGAPLTGHDGPVVDVCAVRTGDDRVLIVSAGADATVRRWDRRGPVGDPMRGHAGVVAAVCAASADGGRLLVASSGDDRTIRLWDPATGEAVGEPLTGHTGGVEALTAVPGRDLLASAAADGTVRLWDTARGTQVGVPLSSMAGALWAISAGTWPDGRTLLATAGEDGAPRLWDLSAALAGGEPPALNPGLVAAVDSAGSDLMAMTMDGVVTRWDAVSLLPRGFATRVEPGLMVMARVILVDGRAMLVSAEHDGTVRRWWLDTLTPYGNPLKGHDGPVLALARWGGAEVASGGADGTVRVWNVRSGEVLLVLRGGSAAIRAVCPLSDSDGRRLLAAGDAAGMIRLWDPRTGEAVGAPVGGHPAPVLALASPRPGVLAVAGVDGTIRWWDVGTRAAVGVPSAAHVSVIRALCQVNGVLASGGGDGQIGLSEVGRPGARGLPGHRGMVRDLCVVPRPGGPPLLASGGHDGTLRLWDPVPGTAIGAPVGGQPGSVDAIATASDHTRVLVGESGRARIWVPGRPGVRLLETTRVINTVAAVAGAVVLGSSDGWLSVFGGVTDRPPIRVGEAAVTALCEVDGGVAVGTADGRLTVWDLGPGRRVRGPIPVHDGPIRAVRSSGHWLVTAGSDGTVRVVDGSEITTMTGHDGWVWSVAVRGSRIASAGADGTVRLSPGTVLTGHTDQVRAVCFLSDTALVSAGHDGTIRIWDVRDRRLHATIPLGVPVHALDHTAGILTAGTRTGVVDLTLDAAMLPR
ncbi:nSTAND1 domain-containing NTPase [Actinoplanes sp. HUAS TT8]|uniref:nSTAND1 domain-containing NTPase n=1 Tax=Actinoplanes sp. HUAS TT8 TaxID=3447453 RepID=UPI003F523BAB